MKTKKKENKTALFVGKMGILLDEFQTLHRLPMTSHYVAPHVGVRHKLGQRGSQSYRSCLFNSEFTALGLPNRWHRLVIRGVSL